MKAREPDIKVRRWVAMLQAADLIEREGKYRFSVCEVPRSCEDVGCVLGWIGYCSGHAGDIELETTAKWLGYSGSLSFYQDMDRFDDSQFFGWHDDHATAAKVLRRLAEETAA